MLIAFLSILESSSQSTLDHIFFNCSISKTKYFSQPEFQCYECGSNQETVGWRQCQCSSGFKATLAVRETNPTIPYPCTACDWATDPYCKPADANTCVQFTTIKKIIGFEEKSPYVCMPCSYGKLSDYSCRCPADTSTIRYKAAFPNTCIETNRAQELRATWQIIGSSQSLTFKCMLQKVG